MSYDLYFIPRRPETGLPVEQFFNWFRKRKNYTVNDSQAFYANESTGVYFAFEYFPGNAAEEDWNGEEWGINDISLLPFSFEINYFRPHIFALEAEPEVAAFIRHFDLLVEDPQINGMGYGEYNSARFLAGWNTGNDFACRTNDGTVYSLPSETIRSTWEWNYNRETLLEKYSRFHIAVPRIVFVEHKGSILTAAVWADGQPIALPATDILLLTRDRLAPRRMFRKKPDTAIVSRDTALAALRRVAHQTDGYYLFDYEHPDKETETFIQRQETSDEHLRVLSVDQVLDRETIQKSTMIPG